ncbi:MAG: ABC transporter permease [Rubrobacteraceae bacterium]
MEATTEKRVTTELDSPRFSATLASEWTKLWTLRSTGAMLLFALILTAGASAIFLLTTGATRGESLAEMRAVDVAGTALLGVDFANLVLIVLCANVVASEYSTGGIRLTLTATPRRLRVLGAKAVVLATVALFSGILAAAAAFVAGQLILLAQGVPVMSPTTPWLLRLGLGGALMVPFYSLLAVALAFITRSAGWAVAAVLAIMSVPALVGALPEWWRGVLLIGLPASSLHSLSGAVSPGSPEYLAPLPAAFVLLAWVAGLLVAAYVSFARRDA